MKLVKGLPPVYDKIVAAVGTPPITALYTYGDTCYSPEGIEPDAFLTAHEEEHMRQQAINGADGWWDGWIASTFIRYSVELAAYKVQYQTFCKYHKDRNERTRYRFGIAQDLSSAMYGRIATFAKAYADIAK